MTHWEGQQRQQEQVQSINDLASSPSSQNTISLLTHMHDNVSVVDGFGFWLSYRNSFQGAKSIVMQTSVVLGPNLRRRGAKLSEGGTPVEESQGSDSIM